MNKKLFITIKHFNSDTKKEANNYVEKVGLKKFNCLAFQFKMIPEGRYEIDTNYIFANQYNTKETLDSNGFRIFEYSECLSNQSVKPLGYGYYISEGIEEIRELQKRIKVCGYCGKQFIDKKEKVFCDNCKGSEHLTKEDYKLLYLVPLLERDSFKYDDVVIPDELIKEIEKQQLESRTKRLKKDIENKKKQLKKEIANAKIEEKGFLWLINNNLDYKNVIYYSHEDMFCFGWRDALTEEEKQELTRVLKDFPFEYKFK